jgi:hypothetical protein
VDYWRCGVTAQAAPTSNSSEIRHATVPPDFGEFGGEIAGTSAADAMRVPHPLVTCCDIHQRYSC